MDMQNNNESHIKTVNPATGQVEKVFPTMSDQQVEELVSRANQAYLTWRHTSFSQRAKLLHDIAGLMRNKKEELARLCAVEMGKRISEGLWEAEICAEIFDYYADNGQELLADKEIDTDGGSAFIAYEPIGVILSIQPWNFPFYQITRSVAPNIMAGNTVVLKHASNVPQCAAMMEQLFDEAGALKGIYTNLFISGSEASELIANPYIKGVTFTGSEPAGSSVAANAGKYVKKSTLELGGSDPLIVMADADLDVAVQMAARGRLSNAGQICVSPKRIIVQDYMLDEFISKAQDIYENIKIGDPLDPATDLGPLVSEKALEGVLKQVDEAVNAGARLVYGGKRMEGAGAYMTPAILTGITPSMAAYSEEIFGPVLCVYPVPGQQAAIKLANDTNYGLGATIVGTDIDEAVKVARDIESGMVYINHVTGIAPELPFGGTKHSGYGREQAEDGIKEFVNHKLIRVSTPEASY
ncbi:MAG: NAD-dependent succinate-semialdehyde dehydrogenase [Tannerellaceae bacterium]|nr:NAD-dependent succinate-semialdehyde dehydrogenase [Tannerellaceae bacterium]MCD8263384.1 NAD-dependent succinate-semialdehyde dehydrogenase [Tannerellaceae bacterium]